MTAEVEKVILTCILIGKIRHSALFSDRAYLLFVLRRVKVRAGSEP